MVSKDKNNIENKTIAYNKKNNKTIYLRVPFIALNNTIQKQKRHKTETDNKNIVRNIMLNRGDIGI